MCVWHPKLEQLSIPARQIGGRNFEGDEFHLKPKPLAICTISSMRRKAIRVGVLHQEKSSGLVYCS